MATKVPPRPGFPADRSFDSSQVNASWRGDVTGATAAPSLQACGGRSRRGYKGTCSVMASPRGHYPLRCHNGGSAVPLHNSVVCLNATARPPSQAAASAANAANAADAAAADAAACNAACSATGAKQQGPLSGESLCLWIAIGATVGNIIVVVVVYVCTFYEWSRATSPTMRSTGISQLTMSL
ncbi:uncharacterized protein C14orf132 homolog isoform X1 [Lampetra fluviatilis]